MRLGVRRSSLGLLVTDALGVTSEGTVWVVARRQGGQFIRG